MRTKSFDEQNKNWELSGEWVRENQCHVWGIVGSNGCIKSLPIPIRQICKTVWIMIWKLSENENPMKEWQRISVMSYESNAKSMNVRPKQLCSQFVCKTTTKRFLLQKYHLFLCLVRILMKTWRRVKRYSRVGFDLINVCNKSLILWLILRKRPIF